jgi:DNA-binding GntR family transcriptional regulator
MTANQGHDKNNQKAVLRQEIEKEMRAIFLQGVFVPGERIIESRISEQLQVSRSPIREVLSALEQEGLVISQPRRGYFMVDFTEKDIQEIYSFRMLLEKFAFNRSISLIDDNCILQLQKLVENMKDAQHSPSGLASMAEADMAFHDTFFNLANHKRLQAAWQSIRSQTMMLMSITSKTHLQQTRQPYQNHQELLEHIKNKNLEDIKAALVDHIDDAMQRALTAVRTSKEVSYP